jgi:lipopolysaccharide export system permease protein
MFKVYQKYLMNSFLIKFLYVSLIFFSLTIILNLLEELSFFKNHEISFLYPYLLTFLNAPITLFEIFPFIFLLATQFLFYDLFKKDELNLLKKNGLNNFKIIKILFFLSISIGIFNVLIFYNLSSILKFQYSNIKNNLSNDNKYLAMVTESGLWIKDEIDNKKFIIKSQYIKGNFLTDTIINEFNNNFELIRTIQSDKVDIKENDWVLYQPKIITFDNVSTEEKGTIILSTNFNEEKINNLFSNISTLNLIELFSQKKEFNKLGYSSDEIDIYLLKLTTMPILYGILTVLASIIMFNFSKNKSQIFHIVLGILMSVMIYYLIFIFSSMGINGKLPVNLSIFFPLMIISLISSIGLVNINDK